MENVAVSPECPLGDPDETAQNATAFSYPFLIPIAARSLSLSLSLYHVHTRTRTHTHNKLPSELWRFRRSGGYDRPGWMKSLWKQGWKQLQAPVLPWKSPGSPRLPIASGSFGTGNRSRTWTILRRTISLSLSSWRVTGSYAIHRGPAHPWCIGFVVPARSVVLSTIGTFHQRRRLV